jgi:hypothetical protein
MSGANQQLPVTIVSPDLPGGRIHAQVFSDDNLQFGAYKQIVSRSFIAVSAPADTNEDILAQFVIPAGSMGINGVVMVHTLWSFTNSINAKTARVRLGGITGMIAQAVACASQLSGQFVTWIANRSAFASQITGAAALTADGLSTAANVTGTIDMSVQQTVVITAQKATGGETMTLEGYFAYVIA